MTKVENGKARELFEIARSCFHYAPRGTPDGDWFEQGETGRLLMNAMEKIAALSASPPKVERATVPVYLLLGGTLSLTGNCVRIEFAAREDAEAMVGALAASPPKVESELDTTPTGALALPKWQYELRASAAVLELTDKPLSADFRLAVSALLGRLQAALTPAPVESDHSGIVQVNEKDFTYPPVESGVVEKLGFAIEDRGGIPILVWSDGGCQPESDAEVSLWRALLALATSNRHEPVVGASYGYCGKCGALLPSEDHLQCALATSKEVTEAMKVERVWPEALKMWTLAAATLERDVLLHGLTEDEQRVMIGAILNAAGRTVATAPSEAMMEAGLAEFPAGKGINPDFLRRAYLAMCAAKVGG
jgi:hypothetical protein